MMMDISGAKVRIRGRLIRVAQLDGEGYDFIEKPEDMIAALRQCSGRIDLFTFMQRISEPTPKYSYPMEYDNLAVMPVTTFEHWWKHQIDSYTRNRARQAEKRGVTIREVSFDEDFVQGISAIYNETPIRQGKRFWHYMKPLEIVRRENGTFHDRSVFIGAFLEGKLIGFAKMTSDEVCGQAGLMQILSMIAHRDKAPTNALIAQAVRSCAARRIPFLFYTKFSFGNKRRDSLADFKYNNGFRRVDLPRYYVPMSPLGAVAYRCGLYRGLEDYVPENVLARFRSIRSSWYAYKLKAMQDAR